MPNLNGLAGVLQVSKGVLLPGSDRVKLPHSDSHLPKRILVPYSQSGHKTAELAQKSRVQELKTGQRRENYII